MAITHVTTKAPGQRLFAVADWNAAHATPSINITGATGNTLIVDTNVLVVDATNNRVGIGTSSPGGMFEVFRSDTGRTRGSFLVDEANNVVYVGRLSSEGGDSSNFIVRGRTGAEYIKVDSKISNTVQFGNLGGERMRISPTGNVGIGTTSPGVSAILELASTIGALLITRLTTAQRNALTAINGMILYNSTDNKFQGYENGAWVNLI